jgi:hypothetical protein
MGVIQGEDEAMRLQHYLYKSSNNNQFSNAFVFYLG